MENFAYSFIFKNLKKTSTQFIVYPFGFDYTDNESTVTNFPSGAVFSTKPNQLPKPSDANYFKFLNATTTVEFGKAKALYDISIAILKIEAYSDDIY